jgi:hypothetical protein
MVWRAVESISLEGRIGVGREVVRVRMDVVAVVASAPRLRSPVQYVVFVREKKSISLVSETTIRYFRNE